MESEKVFRRQIEKEDEARVGITTEDEREDYRDERTAYRNEYDEKLEKGHSKEVGELHEHYGIDPLTGARTRAVLVKELNRLLPIVRGKMEEMREEVEPLKEIALIFIDLDKFKQVNDTHGHIMGDKVLTKVAELLKGSLRGEDVLSRYGGDEFAVLLPGMDERKAMVAAEKLRATLDDDSELKSFGVTASLGVCSTEVSTAIDSENFIKHADGAAYVAKRAGGNRVEVYK